MEVSPRERARTYPSTLPEPEMLGQQEAETIDQQEAPGESPFLYFNSVMQ